VATYREDMRRAWDRINSFPAQRLETRFGTIECADQGEGLPLLASHGVLGCHVDIVDSYVLVAEVRAKRDHSRREPG
jgi:hypothetical protein